MSQLPAAWTPLPEFIRTTNVAWLMREVGVDSYEALHAWSVANREQFWERAIERLGIRFQRPYDRVMNPARPIENPDWLPGARLNIVESCFAARADSPAIIHQAEGGKLMVTSIGELEALTNRVASSLVSRGLKPGDAVAVVLPMTVEAVAIYLGIIKAGCAVVGIADSFQPKEIAVRLRLAKAVFVFTQDVILRGGKELPLYANVTAAEAPPAVVLPAADRIRMPLRSGDSAWTEFLGTDDNFPAVPREPSDPVNILFSSGTTGEPKAIPWTQTTPIKCASDAHFHQNIQPGDILAWPTSLGWMMGPWLIFASLINRAAIALFPGTPTGREFGRFVQEARVTMLGIVPSLVKAWRNAGSLEGLDWSGLKVISSTGECSDPEDMRWLISQAGGCPVIEYCGGTEIGGGYITGTVTRPCVPGTFNAAALGLDLVILDEEGRSAESGESFIVPPSIGLSTTLLNQDHHEVYFSNTPKGPRGETLRRHGDQMERLPGGYWRARGRVDDTMNLGGIKISSSEIEEALRSVPDVTETAAIAISQEEGGPSRLVIYVVAPGDPPVKKEDLAQAMQQAINRNLNPLFKIHDVVVVDALPRTASNKLMRRRLRDQYPSSR